MSRGIARRDFLTATAAAGLSVAANAYAGGNNSALRIGLVGCGVIAPTAPSSFMFTYRYPVTGSNEPLDQLPPP